MRRVLGTDRNLPFGISVIPSSGNIQYIYFFANDDRINSANMLKQLLINRIGSNNLYITLFYIPLVPGQSGNTRQPVSLSQINSSDSIVYNLGNPNNWAYAVYGLDASALLCFYKYNSSGIQNL